MKPPTERQCQALFESYNRCFFGGLLPAYRVLLSDRFGTGLHGICRIRQRKIHLGTELRGAELKEKLIHEMAHAAAGRGHGKLWKAEMHRLRGLGCYSRGPRRVR
jgi:SprT-like family